VGLCGLLVVPLVAQEQPTETETEPPATATESAPESTESEPLSADQEQVHEAIVKFVELYNAKDAAGLAELFAENARLVDRDGNETNGRPDIQASFEEAFAANPDGAISVVVDHIHFLTPDVAVEEGATEFFPDGETLTNRSRYTVLHVKTDGQWRMQSARVREEESLSAYSRLRALEWLVGEWVDESSDSLVETSFQWDANKSFLIQTYQVVRDGVVVLSGTQRIGWDPQAKRIRSWIFDSAGGFGEGTWMSVNSGWVIEAHGMSSEGVNVSGQRIIDPVSQDCYRFSITNRFEDGEPLPDVTVWFARKPSLGK
jgi:uncharacterized protein (TIGR02246 family)